MFIQAARASADQVNEKQLKMGLLFPPQSDILETEVQTAEHVAAVVFERNLARTNPPPNKDIHSWLQTMLFKPEYTTLRPGHK
jgi:malate dehydrogenase (oxaloacetate-decarboxylating)(NADP+)